MGFATVIGIPPVLAAGFPWASFEGNFKTSSDWADGTGRAAETIPVALAATGLSLVVKGTQQPIKIPAIPTGTGQLVSPPVGFEIWGTDTAGNKVLFAMTPRILNADVSNNWHFNTLNTSVTYATNPGPNPVGLTEPQADLLYVKLGQVATTGQAGITRHATDAEGAAGAASRSLAASTKFGGRHVRGGYDPIPRVGELGGIPTPVIASIANLSNLFTWFSGQNIAMVRTGGVFTDATAETVTFFVSFTRTVAVAGVASFYNVLPPSGWSVKSVQGGAYDGSLIVDEVGFADNAYLYFGNKLTGNFTCSVKIELLKI
jgi:hypothetical protein